MTVEVALVLGLVVSAVILFATEKLPVDLTAMIIMGAMLLSGIITPQDAIGGFSNPATITVGAMFVLSAGLFKTGAVNLLGGAPRSGRKVEFLAGDDCDDADGRTSLGFHKQHGGGGHLPAGGAGHCP